MIDNIVIYYYQNITHCEVQFCLHANARTYSLFRSVARDKFTFFSALIVLQNTNNLWEKKTHNNITLGLRNRGCPRGCLKRFPGARRQRIQTFELSAICATETTRAREFRTTSRPGFYVFFFLIAKRAALMNTRNVAGLPRHRGRCHNIAP